MSRILITIPTWNEAVVIERNLRLLQEAVAKYLLEHEVTIEVADNGSTDGTIDMVEHHLPYPIFHIPSRGKGLAIRRSWERHVNDADVLMFTDADLAADLSALPELVAPIEKREADLVCGSRFVQGAVVERVWMRSIGSWLYRALQRMILRLPVKDAQCGFKAISVQTARQLLPLCREDGWMFDSELLAWAKKRGWKTKEIPVRWIEHRDPRRRSALRLFQHGWGFILGLFRVRQRLVNAG